MIKNMGVYKITNDANGKFYIGSSVDLKKRKRDHFRELRNNEHRNERLQHSFNKYGIKNFTFEIIEFAERSKLIEREQFWIDELKASDRNVGFNINRLASGGGNFGEDNGNFGMRGKKNPLSKKIAQINPDTLGIINIWHSSMDIKRTLGFHGGNICKMCIHAKDEKILRMANGFYWCYEEDTSFIKDMKRFIPQKDTSKHRDYTDITGNRNPKARKVVRLTIEGKYLGEYNTIKEAAESIGIKPQSIYSHLCSKRKTSGGYKWMYLEEYKQAKALD